jgi:uncharacterized protein (TIGR02246 family)
MRAAALVLCALAAPLAAAADAVQDVTAATQAWVAAYNSHDPQLILAQYDPAAVFWGTGAATLRDDPAEILDYFQSLLKRPHARVAVEEQRVRVYGDLAINTGTYVFTDVTDGKSVTRPSRFSFTYLMRDGAWRIVDHHSSRVPAANP